MKISAGPQFGSTGGDPRLLIVSARVLVAFFDGKHKTYNMFLQNAGVPEGSRKVRKGFPEAILEADFHEHSDVRVFCNPHIFVFLLLLLLIF